MCIVNEDAFAAGAASIPGPFTDANSDLWFVHQFLMVDMRFVSAVGVEPMYGRQYEFDSKAMRKQNEEQRVVVMIENGHATAAARSYHAFRILTSASYG